MVGRDLTNRFPERGNITGEVILEATNITSPFPKSFKNVYFALRRGEILGIGGLVGAQRTELMEALFSLRIIESGNIRINGKEVKIKSSIDAKKHKLHY